MAERKKAQETFESTEFIYGKKLPFKEAFQSISTLKIVVKERGKGIKPYNEESTVVGSVGEFIDCHNPYCVRGGFNIGEILRDMVRLGDVSYEGTRECIGFEGSPQGKIKKGTCYNKFLFRIDVAYKEPDK